MSDRYGPGCPQAPIVWGANTLPAVADLLAWPLDLTCCTSAGTAPPGVVAMASAAASATIHHLTGHRFDRCAVTVRPCLASSGCGCPTGSGCGGSGCVWAPVDLGPTLRLYGWGQVDSVVEVWSGVAGVKTAIGVPWRWTQAGLHIDPEWPRTHPQHLWQPDGHPMSWGIDMIVGELAPPNVLAATADLACQMIRRCVGEPCDVPENAMSVTRDGVTIRLASGLDAVPSVAALKELEWGSGTPMYVDPSSLLDVDIHLTV